MGRPPKYVPDARQERLRILTNRAKELMLKHKNWNLTERTLQAYCRSEWGLTYKTINDYIAVVNERLGNDKEVLKALG